MTDVHGLSINKNDANRTSLRKSRKTGKHIPDDARVPVRYEAGALFRVQCQGRNVRNDDGQSTLRARKCMWQLSRVGEVVAGRGPGSFSIYPAS